MKKLLLVTLLLSVSAPLMGMETASDELERGFEFIYAVLDPIKTAIESRAVLVPSTIVRNLESLRGIKERLGEFQTKFTAFSSQVSPIRADAALCVRLLRLAKSARVQNLQTSDEHDSFALITKVQARLIELKDTLLPRMRNILNGYDHLPVGADVASSGRRQLARAHELEPVEEDLASDSDDHSATSWSDSRVVQAITALFSLFAGEFTREYFLRANGQTELSDASHASEVVRVLRALPDSDGRPLWMTSDWL